jgi:hypothetical protein
MFHVAQTFRSDGYSILYGGYAFKNSFQRIVTNTISIVTIYKEFSNYKVFLPSFGQQAGTRSSVFLQHRSPKGAQYHSPFRAS